VLTELFLRLHKLTGRDIYRKAVRNLSTKFFSREPKPALPDLIEEAADLDTALLWGQAAASLDEAGYPIKGIQRYFDALLSWIHLNHSNTDSPFNPVGGIKASLTDHRLHFRGFELAHTLLRLSARMKKSLHLPELKLLVSQLLAFSLQKPLGTPSWDPRHQSNDRIERKSSRIWMRELYFLTCLVEQFPQHLPGVAGAEK
jgi:hypothetical protein